MGFYFNMTDVDRNGVITVPEFIKLAVAFGEDVKDGDSDVVKVICHLIIIQGENDIDTLYLNIFSNCSGVFDRTKECR